MGGLRLRGVWFAILAVVLVVVVVEDSRAAVIGLRKLERRRRAVSPS